jgi:fumarate hydratase subunit beta
MAHISLPASSADIAQLKIGETVYLSGVILTARDAAHKYLVESFIKGTPPASELALYEKLKADLAGGAIYHCGPVVSKQDGRYTFVSAGPTTSIREEVYEDLVIEHFGVKVIIGKGGMGARTLKACQQHQAAYLHAIGGAGTLIAASVEEVLDVYKLTEFGAPEAFWKIKVKDFPTVVTMDCHGASIHTTVAEQSKAKLQQLLAIK